MEDITVRNLDLDFYKSGGNKKSKLLIAGPCVIQSWDTCYEIALELKKVAKLYNFLPIFKGSWDKANRTSSDSFRGIDMDKSLEILSRIRESVGIPTITDVHEVSQVKMVSQNVDILQIPAFLCRQTDLIEACANTGKITMVKKGQFLSHESCSFIESKFYKAGGNRMIICERGNSFGYNDLVVDVTSISKLKKHCSNSAVVLDCTHSLQKPNGPYGRTEGQGNYIEDMVKYGAAMNADGLFIETHPYPNLSPSDSENMLELSKLKDVISKARCIYDSL